MIDILLSTYNGERFIKEQLDSILAQTYTKWRLFVRDDQSTDNTNNILNEYQQLYPQKIILFPNNINRNIGVIKSFEILLECSNREYIMFCDQDDIWLPNKIEESLKTIKQLENIHSSTTPILVHSDLTIVNDQKETLHKSFWEYAGIRPYIVNPNPKFLAFCNSVTGCTILMNKACKQQVLPFPEKIEMHDAWIAINIAKKGIIQHINKLLILYLQHSNNTLGAIRYKFNIINRITNIQATYRKAINVYQNYPFLFNNRLDFWYNKLKYFIIRHFIK